MRGKCDKCGQYDAKPLYREITETIDKLNELREALFPSRSYRGPRIQAQEKFPDMKQHLAKVFR